MNSTAFLTIAYVTVLLKSLLEHGRVRDKIADLVGGLEVSVLPPNQVASGMDEQAHINLFLSHIAPNTRVRSFERIEQGARADGSVVAAPLALDLHYIITADSAKELQVETLLGYVSTLFRECSTLIYNNDKGSWYITNWETDQTEAIATPVVPGASSQLPELIGSIGIRPLFPSADELSKVWSALQVKYRPSLSYKVEIQPERAGRPATMAALDLQRVR